MSTEAITVARAKWRTLENIIQQIRSHVWIHVVAGFVTLFMVVGLGGGFFWFLFRFLMNQEPFGPPLMERLLAIVLLAFFSMLIFSNLIITLTTTYISKETEYLLTLPLSFRGLFGVKFSESVAYSSWAFVLLSLPLFVAYGAARHAHPAFYPAALAMGIPFLVIPAAIGAVITMLVSAYLPARKARVYTVMLLAAALAISAAIVKLMGLRSMVISANFEDFSRIMELLNVGSAPLLPNYWLARGMSAMASGRFGEAGYWFLVLLSTAMMAVQICLWMVPRLYYRGWSLARESASPVATYEGNGVLRLFDRAFGAFTPPVRALLSKDLRTFVRDPAQWSQLIILFGLLVFYIANIRGLSKQLQGIDAFIRQWPTILSFFNMGATCFVLSILTTRFVYPMLSLEGKQYWVIGLAPFRKEKLVWEKFWLCAVVTGLMALVLILYSNRVLSVHPYTKALSVVTVMVLTVGLTSLSVGLGAIFPDFQQDNPARIANGLGGTLNIVLSLFYVSGVIALEMPIALALGSLEPGHWPSLLALLMGPALPFLAAVVIVNATVIVAPMVMGIRSWRRMEFHL